MGSIIENDCVEGRERRTPEVKFTSLVVGCVVLYIQEEHPSPHICGLACRDEHSWA